VQWVVQKGSSKAVKMDAVKVVRLVVMTVAARAVSRVETKGKKSVDVTV
jgi:hypothetical protein